jgi:hypothetical protein
MGMKEMVSMVKKGSTHYLSVLLFKVHDITEQLLQQRQQQLVHLL